MIPKKIFSFIFICLFLNSYSQQPMQLVSFKALVSNNKVLLNWTLDSGSTCSGTSVLKSLNGIDYLELGKIPGVCGSTSSQQSYSFIDESPFKNQDNFYQLKFGDQQLSIPVSIYFKYLQPNSIRLFPIPAENILFIEFNSNNNENLKYEIRDVTGKIVKSFVIIKGEQDQINIEELRQGYYLLLVYENFKLKAIEKFLIFKP